MNTATNTRTWLWMGAIEGAKCSVGLALAYALWFVFSERIALELLPTYFVEWVTNTPNAYYTPQTYVAHLQQALAEMPVALLANSGMGFIPALLIGIVSGGGLGWFLSRHTHAPYPKSRLMVGAVFALSVTLVVNMIAYRLSDGARDLAIYLLFVGIPSLVYIGVCLWLSQRIPLVVERASIKELPTSPTPLPIS